MIDFAMIQSKLSQYCSAAINGNGAPLHLARRLAAAATAFLLISTAFFVLLFSGVDARAGGLFGTCADAGDLAVLPSPLSPWRGAPLRVVFAAEKPMEGELSLIAPDGSVAARSRGRYGGPPYFWFAEVASPARGNVARSARARRMQRDHPRNRRQRHGTTAAARHAGQHMAAAQYLESRDGKFVFGVDREAVRRAARCGTVVAGAVQRVARSIAQFSVQLSGCSAKTKWQ